MSKSLNAQISRPPISVTKAMDKLVPNDHRVRYEQFQIRGKTYSAIVAEPAREPISTIVLIHGFPDLAFGWRVQIPYLQAQGYRVIAPDMLGYGGTDAPQSLEHYSLKSMALDIAKLAQLFVGETGQVILGGHDWGGGLVWRIALWHPELIKGAFTVCTPFMPPSPHYSSLEEVVAKLPNFSYQTQFAGLEVEQQIQGETKLRQFFNAVYGAEGPSGEVGLKVKGGGIQFANLPKLGQSPLLTSDELDFYVEQYMRQEAPQMRGPLNWYRISSLTHREELELTEKPVLFEFPAMLITATEDEALPPWMSHGMEQYFKNLKRVDVKASHWALTEAGEQVNREIAKWIDDILAMPAL
ncbi:uncharacterized protein JN550_004463 [Neoarthrinium moseri]|uniref:uncharacterized protein n=1 Tax=Neoarthrinium moseri TaxID=1658444 RepID=UPI001FDB1025|nr:uncharacterized protein JN550_004463 [Neoarthrinium moseri]KAI1871469.1 hypothetical protein JN550_004463 [Neoarthrinium moseri]